MTDCRQYEEWISVLLDGELPEEQAMQLRAHMASCESCRAIYQAFSAMSCTVSQCLEEPPEGFTQAVMAAIEKKEKKAPVIRLHWGRWVAAAACFLVVVVSAIGFLPWRDAAPPAILAAESMQDAAAPEPENTGPAISRESPVEAQENETTDENTQLQTVPEEQFTDKDLPSVDLAVAPMPGSYCAENADDSDALVQPLAEVYGADGSLLCTITDSEKLVDLCLLLIGDGTAANAVLGEPDYTVVLFGQDGARTQSLIWAVDGVLYCADDEVPYAVSGTEADFEALLNS